MIIRWCSNDEVQKQCILRYIKPKNRCVFPVTFHIKKGWLVGNYFVVVYGQYKNRLIQYGY